MSSLYLASKFVVHCENSPSILMNAPSVKLFVVNVLLNKFSVINGELS